MNTDYTINPKTGRLVKYNSPTYRKLVNEGVIKNKKQDPKIAYKLDTGDDIDAIKKDLKNKIKLKKNEVLRKGIGKNKNKIMIAYKGGRHKKDETDSDKDSDSNSDDEFEKLCKKLDVNLSKKPAKKPVKKPAKLAKQVYVSESEEESEEEKSEQESSESE
jgi:hypothetical protein